MLLRSNSGNPPLADKVAAVGVCEGAAEVLVAAASNPSIKAAAIISGHYRDHDNDVALIGGLELMGGEITKEEAEARLQLRTEKAKAALEKYKATGEVGRLLWSLMGISGGKKQGPCDFLCLFTFLKKASSGWGMRFWILEHCICIDNQSRESALTIIQKVADLIIDHPESRGLTNQSFDRSNGNVMLTYKHFGLMQVEYIPIVDPLRKDVALPMKPIWDWYHGWADRGIWENRVALMSYVR